MKLPYGKKRPKHEPTESYFDPARQIDKCMMRSDNLNWYNHGSYTKMTAPYSNVNGTNESESKRSIVNKKLSQSCSTNENQSKQRIVNEPLSQKCSAKENKLFSTKEDNSECLNKKQKDTKNEIARNVTNYFNVSIVFECGRNNPGVSCERACMATGYNEYFTDVLDTLNEYQDRHDQSLSSKKLKEALLCVMGEEEEEIKSIISDSKERVDDISDSKEGVDNISDSNEQVDDRNDSNEHVGVKNDS